MIERGHICDIILFIHKVLKVVWKVLSCHTFTENTFDCTAILAVAPFWQELQMTCMDRFALIGF